MTKHSCRPDGTTAALSAVKATLSAAERLGLTREQLLSTIPCGCLPRAAGDVCVEIDGDRPEEDTGRVPLPCLANLDDAIQTQLGPASAIHLAEMMAGTSPSLLEYLCQCSRTLGECLEQLSRYSALTLELPAPTLEIRDGRARFGCVYPQALVERLGVSIEKELAGWLARARYLTRADWSPCEVHLQMPATDVAEYQRFFRAPVRNGAAGCWIEFDAALLELPIATGDGSLLRHLRPVADAVLADLTLRQGFAPSVRTTMLRLMADGTCGIEDVARALAVSPRTLQRRLESEGTTFGAMFDETRRAAALECLRNPRMAIKEAAFRVGFSEPSTFYRAFRRWTGATPAGYRRSLAM